MVDKINSPMSGGASAIPENVALLSPKAEAERARIKECKKTYVGSFNNGQDEGKITVSYKCLNKYNSLVRETDNFIKNAELKLAQFKEKPSSQSAAELGEALFYGYQSDVKSTKLLGDLGADDPTQEVMADVISFLNSEEKVADFVPALMSAAIKHKIPYTKMEKSEKAGFGGFVENIGNVFYNLFNNAKRFFTAFFTVLFKSGMSQFILDKVLGQIGTITDLNVRNIALAALAKFARSEKQLDLVLSNIQLPKAAEDKVAYDSVCKSVLSNSKVNKCNSELLKTFLGDSSKISDSHEVMQLISCNKNSHPESLENIVEHPGLPEGILSNVAGHANASPKALMGIVKYASSAAYVSNPDGSVEIANAVSVDTLLKIITHNNADAEVVLATINHANSDSKILQLSSVNENIDDEGLYAIATKSLANYRTLRNVVNNQLCNSESLQLIMENHGDKLDEKFLIDVISNRNMNASIEKLVLNHPKFKHDAVVAALNNNLDILEGDKELRILLKSKINDLRSSDKLALLIKSQDIEIGVLGLMSSEVANEVKQVATSGLSMSGLVSKEEALALENNNNKLREQITALESRLQTLQDANGAILNKADSVVAESYLHASALDDLDQIAPASPMDVKQKSPQQIGREAAKAHKEHLRQVRAENLQRARDSRFSRASGSSGE